jgi:site-specific DNA-methyltransferase (adenine-specific)
MQTPYYADDLVTLYLGDCLDVMRELPAASVDAIVTDPPYGLGFMGKAWDALPPGLPWAQECYRVLKPGGHLLAFGGTRTWHRLAVAVEDAGFEIRDSIAWLYGSGFPKSLDVSKAIDKAAGAERGKGVPGRYSARRPRAEVSAVSAYQDGVGDYGSSLVTEPATPAAQQWQGWGTALKPAFEPVVVGRKPLDGTVAANVLTHGVGALNIDGCRIATDEDRRRNARGGDNGLTGSGTFKIRDRFASDQEVTSGRWPANVVLDDSQAAALDQQSGTLTSGKMQPTHTDASRQVFGKNAAGGYTTMETYGDSGGASRFFPTFRYEAKAGSAERPTVNGTAHPTVKPLDLMRWLVRLVTPPGGVVLEPFLGSGTTAEACVIEGFRCIGIERDETYARLARSRFDKPIQPTMFGDCA